MGNFVAQLRALGMWRLAALVGTALLVLGLITWLIIRAGQPVMGLLYADLEQRLSELYVSTPDKVQLEKDLAAIHPHKKWLLKTIPPVEVKVETAEIVPEEKSSNADGCDCKECRAYKPCPCTMNRNWEQKSGVDGSTKEKQATSIYDYAGPMGMLIVFGIFVIALRGTNR
jgi:hypothetical protein